MAKIKKETKKPKKKNKAAVITAQQKEEDDQIKKGSLLKLFIPMLVGIIAVVTLLIVGISKFEFEFILEEDGYAIPQNVVLSSLNASAKESAPLYKFQTGESVYSMKGNLGKHYVGDEKEGINSRFPMYTRSGQVLYFIDDKTSIITNDWDTLQSYEGLRESDGQTFNGDNSKADLKEVILIDVDYGYQIAQETSILTSVADNKIPMNTICEFGETKIDCFEFNKGMINSYSIPIHADSTIKIGDNAYKYGDFLVNIGVWKKGTGTGDNENNVEEAVIDDSIEGEDHEASKKKKTASTDTPLMPTRNDTPSEPPVAPSGTYQQPSAPKQNTEKAPDAPPAPPVWPDFVQPIVRFDGKNVDEWVYNLTIPTIIYDPSGAIQDNGVQIYANEVIGEFEYFDEEDAMTEDELRVLYDQRSPITETDSKGVEKEVTFDEYKKRSIISSENGEPVFYIDIETYHKSDNLTENQLKDLYDARKPIIVDDGEESRELTFDDYKNRCMVGVSSSFFNTNVSSVKSPRVVATQTGMPSEESIDGLDHYANYTFGQLKPDTYYIVYYYYTYKDQNKREHKVGPTPIGLYFKSEDIDSLDVLNLTFNNVGTAVYPNNFEIGDICIENHEDEYTTPILPNTDDYYDIVLPKPITNPKMVESYIASMKVEYVPIHNAEPYQYPFFDSSTSYNVNDIVQRVDENNVSHDYICLKDTPAGDWNEANWKVIGKKYASGVHPTVQNFSSLALNILKRGFHLKNALFGNNKLGPNTNYTYRIVILDRFGNELSYTGATTEYNYDTSQDERKTSDLLHYIRTCSNPPKVSINIPAKKNKAASVVVETKFGNINDCFIDTSEDTTLFFVPAGQELKLENAITISAVLLDDDGNETSVKYTNVKQLPIVTENNKVTRYLITNLASRTAYTAAVWCPGYDINDHRIHEDEILDDSITFLTGSLASYGSIQYSGYADNITYKRADLHLRLSYNKDEKAFENALLHLIRRITLKVNSNASSRTIRFDENELKLYALDFTNAITEGDVSTISMSIPVHIDDSEETYNAIFDFSYPKNNIPQFPVDSTIKRNPLNVWEFILATSTCEGEAYFSTRLSQIAEAPADSELTNQSLVDIKKQTVYKATLEFGASSSTTDDVLEDVTSTGSKPITFETLKMEPTVNFADIFVADNFFEIYNLSFTDEDNTITEDKTGSGNAFIKVTDDYGNVVTTMYVDTTKTYPSVRINGLNKDTKYHLEFIASEYINVITYPNFSLIMSLLSDFDEDVLVRKYDFFTDGKISGDINISSLSRSYINGDVKQSYLGLLDGTTEGENPSWTYSGDTDTWTSKLVEVQPKEKYSIFSTLENEKSITSYLPTYLKELEYIESRGQQYIKTGYFHNEKTEVIFDVLLQRGRNNWNMIFGARPNGTWKGTADWCFGFNDSSDYDTYYLSAYNKNGNKLLAIDNYSDWKTLRLDKTTLNVNGEIHSNYTEQEIVEYDHFIGTSPIEDYLFAGNNNNVADWQSWIKLRSCQILEDGVLLKNFVPCLAMEDVPSYMVNTGVKAVAGTAGLYDTIGQKFYVSSQTNFGYKKDNEVEIYEFPEDIADSFKQLDYIESNQTQYIETGYKHNNNTVLDAEYVPLKGKNTWNALFGSRTATVKADTWDIGFNDISGYNTYFLNTSKANLDYILPILDNTGYSTMHLTRSDLTIDGAVASSGVTSIGNATYTDYIFADHNGANYNSVCDQGNYQLHSLIISENDVDVRHFIPAITTKNVYWKVNGEYVGNNFLVYVNQAGEYTHGSYMQIPAKTAGLFDTVNEVFYIDCRGGNFDYPQINDGEIKLPDYLEEVKYIRSNGNQALDLGFTPTVNTQFETEWSGTDAGSYAILGNLWAGQGTLLDVQSNKYFIHSWQHGYGETVMPSLGRVDKLHFGSYANSNHISLGDGREYDLIWKLERYAKQSPSYPRPSHVYGKTVNEVRFYGDHGGNGFNVADNYTGRATTYIHCTDDYTVSLGAYTDDNGSITITFPNHTTQVWDNASTKRTYQNVTFKAGWNRVEMVYTEGTGGDGFDVAPDLTSLPVVDKVQYWKPYEWDWDGDPDKTPEGPDVAVNDGKGYQVNWVNSTAHMFAFDVPEGGYAATGKMYSLKIWETDPTGVHAGECIDGNIVEFANEGATYTGNLIGYFIPCISTERVDDLKTSTRKSVGANTAGFYNVLDGLFYVNCKGSGGSFGYETYADTLDITNTGMYTIDVFRESPQRGEDGEIIYLTDPESTYEGNKIPFVDEEGNPLTDEEGNILFQYETILIKAKETIGDLIGNGNTFEIPEDIKDNDPKTKYYLQVNVTGVPRDYNVADIHLDIFDDSRIYSRVEDPDDVSSFIVTEKTPNLLSGLASETNSYIEGYSYDDGGKRIMSEGFAVTTQFIKVIPDSVYYLEGLNSYSEGEYDYSNIGLTMDDANRDKRASSQVVAFYNQNKEFIGTSYVGTQGSLFKTPTSAYFARFVMRGDVESVADANVEAESELKLNSNGYTVTTYGRKYKRNDTGNPLYVKFIPSESGVYTFYSGNVISGDPYIYVCDENKKPLVNVNNTIIPGEYFNPETNTLTDGLISDDDTQGNLNFRVDVELEGGKTYYIRPTHSNTLVASAIEYDIFATDHRYKFHPENARLYLYAAADLEQYTATFDAVVRQKLEEIISAEESETGEAVTRGALNGGVIKIKLYQTINEVTIADDLDSFDDDQWAQYLEEPLYIRPNPNNPSDEPIGDELEMLIAPESIIIPAGYGYKVSLYVTRRSVDTGELYDAEILLDSATFSAVSPVYVIKDIPTLQAVARDMAGYYICIADIYGVDFTVSDEIFTGVIDWQGHSVELASSYPLFDKIGSGAIIKNGDFVYSQEQNYLATDITYLGESGVKYTELEYIESTGTQFINTGVIPNQDTEVEVEWSGLSDSTNQQAIVGNGWSGNCMLLNVQNSSYYIHGAGPKFGYTASEEFKDTIHWGTKSNQTRFYRHQYTEDQKAYNLEFSYLWKYERYPSLGNYVWPYENANLLNDDWKAANRKELTYGYGDLNYSITMNKGDTYTAVATTYCYVPNPDGCTIPSMTFYVDDYMTVTLNGAHLTTVAYGNTNHATTVKNMHLVQGWNELILTYTEGSGGDGMDMSPKLYTISGITKRSADKPYNTDELSPSVNPASGNKTDTIMYPTSTLKAFAIDANGTHGSYGKMYSLKIWDGENLVRDYVPVARSTDNMAGLYDKVNAEFYPNTGKGVFIKGAPTGNIIEPDPIPFDEMKQVLTDMGIDISEKTDAEIRQLYRDNAVKKEFILLDYIESTGTQFIGTRIRNSSSVDYEVEFERTAKNNTEQTIIGTNYSAADQTAIVLKNDGKSVFTRITNNRTFFISGLNLNQRVKYSLVGTKFAVDDGVEHSTIVTRDNYDNSYICIFAQNNTGGSPAYGKLYGVKLYKGGDCIFDAVPVVTTTTYDNSYVCYRGYVCHSPAPAGTPGLYDKNTEEFYYSYIPFVYPELPYTDLISTSSVAGADTVEDWLKELADDPVENPHTLPDNFAEVKYVDSGFNSYVDTGVKGSRTTVSELKFAINSYDSYNSYDAIFGTRNSWNVDDRKYSLYLHYQNKNFYASYGNNPNKSDKDIGVATECGVDYLLTFDGSHGILVDKIDTGQRIVDYASVVSATDTPQNICIGGVNSAGSIASNSSIRIYGCKITKNGTLVRDFVPCISLSDISGESVSNGSDVKAGTPGLMDLVSGVFYPSASSTPLKAAYGIVHFKQNSDKVITDTACIARTNYGLLSNIILHYGPQSGAAFSVKENSAGFVLDNYGTIDTFALQFVGNVNVKSNVSGVALRNYGTISNGYVCGTEFIDAEGSTVTSGLVHRYDTIDSISAVTYKAPGSDIETDDDDILDDGTCPIGTICDDEGNVTGCEDGYHDEGGACVLDNPSPAPEPTPTAYETQYFYTYKTSTSDAGYLSYISSYNKSRGVIKNVYVADNLMIQSLNSSSGEYGNWIYGTNFLVDGIVQIDSLESTGSQYIDTGLYVNNRLYSGSITFEYTNSAAKGYIMGAVNSSWCGIELGKEWTNRFYFPQEQKDSKRAYMYVYNSAGTNSSYNVAGRLVGKFNANSPSGYSIPYTNILLFGRKSNSLIAAKIYSAQFYYNGSLVRDFIPAKTTRDIDGSMTNTGNTVAAGTAGLYDKIEGKFYTSATTSRFISNDSFDSSALNTDYSALITGYNEGEVRDSFTSGDVLDFEFTENSAKGLAVGSKSAMRRIGPAIGAISNSYSNPNVSYISLENVRYNNLNTSSPEPYMHDFNKDSEAKSLYDYIWYQDKLGNDGTKFNLRSSIAAGHYPQLIMNSYIPASKIPYANLPEAQVSLRLIGSEIREIGQNYYGKQTALATLLISNPGTPKVDIKNINIVDSVGTPLDAQVLAQGSIDDNYRVDVLITYDDTSSSSGVIPLAESQYTIESYDTSSASGKEFTATSGENILKLELFHDINSTSNWSTMLSDTVSEHTTIVENYRLTRDLNFSSSASFRNWAVFGDFQGKLDGAIYDYSEEITLKDYSGQIMLDEIGAERTMYKRGEMTGMHSISGIGNVNAGGQYVAGRAWDTVSSAENTYLEYNSARHSLFRYVSGSITNLIFKDFRTARFDDIDNSLYDVTSAICGVIARTTSGSIIDNCHVRDSEFNTRGYGGSLIGYASNTSITNCSARNVSVKGNQYPRCYDSTYLGGLIGYAYNSKLEGNFTSEISVSADRLPTVVGAGGIAGSVDYTTFYACYVGNGLVATSTDCVGGIVGKVGAEAKTTDNEFNHATSIENCWTTVTVQTEGDFVGGLAGYMGLYNGADDKPLANKLLNNYTNSTVLSMNYSATHVNRIINYDYENQKYYYNNYAFENQSINYKKNAKTSAETYQFGPKSELNGASRLLKPEDIADSSTWSGELGFDENFYDLSVVENDRMMPKLINTNTGQLLYDQSNDNYLGTKDLAKLEVVRAINNTENKYLDISLNLYNFGWNQDMFASYAAPQDYQRDTALRTKWGELADWNGMAAVGGSISTGVSGDEFNFTPVHVDEPIVDENGHVGIRFNTHINYADPVLGHYSDSYLISVPVYLSLPGSTPKLMYTAYALIVLDENNIAVAQIENAYEWNEFFNADGNHYNTLENIKLTGDIYDFGHANLWKPEGKPDYPTAFNAAIDKIYLTPGKDPVFQTGPNENEAVTVLIDKEGVNSISFISTLSGEMNDITFANFYIAYNGLMNTDPQGIIGTLSGIMTGCKFNNVRITNLCGPSMGIIGQATTGAYLENIEINGASLRTNKNTSYFGGLAGKLTGISSRYSEAYKIKATDVTINTTALGTSSNYYGGVFGYVQYSNIDDVIVSSSNRVTPNTQALDGSGGISSDFSEVEYIECVGGLQVINTMIKQASDLRIEMDAQFVNTGENARLIGSLATNHWFQFGYDTSNNGYKVQSGGGSMEIWAGAKDTTRHKYVMDAVEKKFYIDSTSYDMSGSGRYTVNTTNPINIFGYYSDGTGTKGRSRLYSISFYNKNSSSTVPSYQMIPCVSNTEISADRIANSNVDAPKGTVGLYDLITDKFYVNSTNTKFVVGPSYNKGYSHIYGNSYTGGVAGYADNANIKNVTVQRLAITANGDYNGGVIGKMASTTIENVKEISDIHINSGSTYNGAMFGRLDSGNNVTEALLRPTTENSNIKTLVKNIYVTGTQYNGGLIGYTNVGDFRLRDLNVNNIEVINRDMYGGGLIGDRDVNTHFVIENLTVDGITVSNDSRYTNTTSDSHYGGLVGDVANSAGIEVNDSTFKNLNVSADRYVGGLFGRVVDSSYTGIMNFSNVAIENVTVNQWYLNNDSGFAGGVIGEDCYLSVMFNNGSTINGVTINSNAGAAGGVVGRVWTNNRGDLHIFGSDYLEDETENLNKRLKVNNIVIRSYGDYVGGFLGNSARSDSGNTSWDRKILNHIVVQNIDIKNVQLVALMRRYFAGGVAGNASSVMDCVIGDKAVAQAAENIGKRGTVGSQASVEITGFNEFVGGAVGFGGYLNEANNEISRNEVYNVKIISTDPNSDNTNNGIAGVVGYCASNAKVNDNYVENVYISGPDGIAGVVGYRNSANFNTQVSGNTVVDSVIISNCNDDAKRNRGVAGIVAKYDATNYSLSENEVKNSSIIGNTYAGGIAANVTNSNIYNCGTEDTLVLSSYGQYVGGIVGYFPNNDRSIFNCYVKSSGTGTGTVNYGDLVGKESSSFVGESGATYRYIDYVETTGTQYINTGVYPDSTVVIRAQFQNLAATGNLIIGGHVNENDTFRFFNSGNVCYLDYGSGNGKNRINGSNIYERTLYNVEIGNRYVKDLNTGNNIISGSAVSFGVKGYTIGLSGGSLTASKNRFYYVDIFKGGEQVRKLRPVVVVGSSASYYEGQVGMYDLKEGKFYPNAANSDNLVAAPSSVYEDIFNKFNKDESNLGLNKSFVLSAPSATEASASFDKNNCGGIVGYFAGSSLHDCYVGNATLVASYQNTTDTVTATGGLIGYTLKNNSSAAVDYEQLEYIESTGTQYIKTGYNPDSTSEFELDFAFTCENPSNDWSKVFGVSDGTDLIFVQSNKNEPYTDAFSLSFGRNADPYRAISPKGYSLGARTYLVAKNGYVEYSDFDGTVKSNTASAECTPLDFVVDKDLYIFATNSNGSVAQNSYYKLYSFKIYDSKTGTRQLARDFTPVKRRSDGVVGLYDKVQGKFYTNAGSASFVAGSKMSPTPSETYRESYTVLDYLTSTAKTVINSGVKSSNDMEFKFKAKLSNSSYCRVFGVYDKNNGSNRLLLQTTKSNGGYSFYHKSGEISPRPAYTSTLGQVEEYDVVVKSGGSSISVNGTQIYHDEETITVNAKNIGVFNLLDQNGALFNDNGNVGHTIYNMQIFDKGNLVRDFVCVKRDADGVLGMFDKVHEQFYPNAGTESFVAGPETGEKVYTTYTRVSYVQSSNTAFDTGIAVDKNTRWEFEYAFTGTSNQQIGVGAADDGKRFIVYPTTTGLNMSLGKNYTDIAKYDTFKHSYVLDSFVGEVEGGTKPTMDVILDGKKYDSNQYASRDSLSLSGNIHLFGRKDASSVSYVHSGKLYSSTISKYEDSDSDGVFELKVVQKLVPVRKTDGSFGLIDIKDYDSTNNVFTTIPKYITSASLTGSSDSSDNDLLERKTIYDCVVAANVASYGSFTDESESSYDKKTVHREATGGIIGFYGVTGYSQDTYNAKEISNDGSVISTLHMDNGKDYNTVLGPDPLTISNFLFSGNIKAKQNAGLVYGVAQVTKLDQSYASQAATDGHWKKVDNGDPIGMYIYYDSPTNPTYHKTGSGGETLDVPISIKEQIDIDYKASNDDLSTKELGSTYVQTKLSARKPGASKLRVLDTSELFDSSHYGTIAQVYLGGSETGHRYTEGMSALDRGYNELQLVNASILDNSSQTDAVADKFETFFYGDSRNGNMELNYSFWKNIFGGENQNPIEMIVPTQLSMAPVRKLLKSPQTGSNDTETLIDRMNVYSSGIDTVNLELHTAPQSGLTYTIESMDDEISGVWPQGQRTITVNFDYSSDLTVTLTSGGKSDSAVFTYSSFTNTMMAYGSSYWYLFNNEAINSGGKSINKGTTFIHMYGGFLLDKDGNIYNAENGKLTGQAKELSLASTKALWSGIINSNGTSHTVKTFASYSLSDNLPINARLYVKNGNLFTLSASRNIVGGPIADTYGGNLYATVLLDNGQLSDLGSSLKYPENFKKTGISEISSTIGYTGHIMLVRYTNGTLKAFDYLTGTTISVSSNEPSTLQSLGSYLSSSLSNLFKGRNLGGEVGMLDEASQYEQTVQNNPGYASALKQLDNTNSNLVVSGNSNANGTVDTTPGVGTGTIETKPIINEEIVIEEADENPDGEMTNGINTMPGSNITQSKDNNEGFDWPDVEDELANEELETYNIENSYIALYNEESQDSQIYETDEILSKPIEECLSEEEKAQILEQLGLKVSMPAKEENSKNIINGVGLIVLILLALAMLISTLFYIRRRNFSDNK